MLRIGWEKVEAKLVDSVLVRKDAFQSEMGGRTPFQVWDYMVEVPGRDGKPTRLVIREKSFEVELPERGKPFPVLVNKKRTKAAFDLDDPEVGTRGRQKIAEARKKERQQAKRAKFDEKLRGD